MTNQPVKTILIDTENGYESVADLIDAGTVERVHAPTYLDVAKAIRDIRSGKIKGDVIVLDTLTSLATRTRRDMVGEINDSVSVWENRNKLQSQQKDWGSMSDALGRMLLEFTGLPQRLIVLSHEGMRDDGQGTEKKAPDLNAALLREVLAYSSGIVRLATLARPLDYEGTVYPVHTRVLRTLGDENCIAKLHTTLSANAPPLIFNPTWAKLVGALGSTPKTLAIYGSPGSGKTTFACDASRVTKNDKTRV